MRRLIKAILWIAAVLAIGWSALALYYASGVTPEWARIALALGPPVIALVAAWRLRGIAVFLICAVVFGGVLGWWLSITPSNDRDWQPDVARLAYATFDGDKVTIHNIRDFDYRTETDYTPRYFDKTVDLNDIRTIDIVSSYWAGELIAHLFLSFGFADGEQIAISIETRKEKTESYSTLAGFFRQYEIIYVVGAERDLIGLRTNFRRPPEDVYVYRTRATPAGARRMFESYLRVMNYLVDHPRFYNTLTTNCTTVIAMHTQANPSPMPTSWKVLASGLFAEYAYELGYLDSSLPFRELKQQAHVNARANAAGAAEDFSARIRAGTPAPKR
jgi:Domain of unknown function (DUF4105)